MPGPDPLELPAPVLDEALARLVAEDGGTRERVLAELIAAHPEHGSALRALHETLAGANRMLARTFSDGVPAAADEPLYIERYGIVRRLGEGAFGVVYLCEQREPIHRMVAIKVLRPGAGDRRTLARFDSERRFLARLHHPSIAQIFDAGLLPDGRPWFVMEHVPGVPLTDYCNREQLPIEARLSLFARLCQGVQHAHEQGIVHRDLKPANVLVVEIDGEAQPKIIDFGIAKALEQTDGTPAHTEPGRVVGTPGYMSPEQASGSLADVDARSDLFSLGVILYELLTGELPWGKRPDTTATDPPLPSRRIATGTQQATDVAHQRRTQPKKLARHLRGDLDWIVLKALSRERSRRYASALELAADVQRHLRGEAVLAGPPSIRYRLRKLARRRRTVLANAAAGIVLVGAGMWLLGHFRAEARSRGEEAEAAVASLLKRANDEDLVDKPGAEAIRRRLAQDALVFYDRFLAERPEDLAARERRAKALWTLSQVHWLLGQFARSEAMAREAVVDGEALVAAAPANVAYRRQLGNAVRNLGRAVFSGGHPQDARAHFERAVALLEQCEADEPDVLRGLLMRALLELRSTLDEATEAKKCDELLRRACELQEAIVAKYPDRAYERTTLLELDVQRTSTALERGDVAAGKQLLQRARDWLAAGADVQPGLAASVYTMLAQIASIEGDLSASIAHMESAVAADREWVAKEPTKPEAQAKLCFALGTLSDLLIAAPRYAEAERVLRDSVEQCDAWCTRFPEDPRAPLSLVRHTRSLIVLLLPCGTRSALHGTDAAARRAHEVLPRLPLALPAGERMHTEWMTLGCHGMVADALALPEADRVWDETAEALAKHRAAGPLPAAVVAEHVMYSLRIARHQLDAGRTADAEATLAVVKDLVDRHREAMNLLESYVPELARLRTRATVERGDLAAAAAIAETALTADDYRAADGAASAMSTVWRAARRRGDDPSAWRDRAIELCRKAIGVLQGMLPTRRDELWVVMPLAQTRVLLALAQRDAGIAFDTAALATALDDLGALRDDMHANEWDESLYAAGKSLLAR